MRILFIVVSVVVCSIMPGAADYYVATSGDDADPGTLAEPFATIQRGVNQLVAGDTLWIRGGDYCEQVSVMNLNGTAIAPVTITNYGDEAVKLDGTIPIPAAWIQHSGNIYKTTLPEDIYQLFLNGEEMVMARWPNAFFHDESVYNFDYWATSNNAADSNGNVVHQNANGHDLAGTGLDLTGAHAVLNVGSWKSWVRPITAHTPGSGTFAYDIVPAGEFVTNEHRYFVEGKLNFLDAAREWFYSPTTNVLYFWQPGGGLPSGVIRGKTDDYALSLQDCSHVIVRGLDFFGTTIKANGSEYITLEDAYLDHPSTNQRMLGVLNVYTMTHFRASGGTSSDSYSAVRNCVFAHTDGAVIHMRGRGNAMENCYLHHIDWSAAEDDGTGGSNLQSNVFSVIMNGEEVTCRRITMDMMGASEGLTTLGSSDGRWPHIIELCRLSNGSRVNQDGGMVQFRPSGMPAALVRFNWANDCDANGLRFDGGGGPPNPPGMFGSIHHNVVWNCERLSVKGDDHRVINNTSFDNLTHDIMIWDRLSFNGINTSTETRNNAAGTISGEPAQVNGDYPGIKSNNITGDIRGELRDWSQRDFRPRFGSSLIDAGVAVEGFTVADFTAETITEGNLLEQDKAITETAVDAPSQPGTYVSPDLQNPGTPDVGAYEYGSDEYWIPGFKQAQATVPIPNDGAVDQALDRDLIFLLGYQGASADVYLGTDQAAVTGATLVSPEYRGSLPDPKNIFSPVLLPGATYYWRVDTVLADSSVVPGTVWSFTTLDSQLVSDDFESAPANGDPLNPPWSTQVEAGAPDSIQVVDMGSNQAVRLLSETLSDRSVFGVADGFAEQSLISISFDVYRDGVTPVSGSFNLSVGQASVAAGANQLRHVALNPHVSANNWYHFDWIVNQSGSGVDYTVSGVTQSVAAGSADLWRDGELVINDGTSRVGTATGTDTTLIDSFGWTLNNPDTGDWRIDTVKVRGLAFVEAPSNLFAAWAAGFGLIGADGLRLTDLEPDGLENLLEYAFGGSPLAFDAVEMSPVGGLVNDPPGGPWFQYCYRRRIDYAARGLVYTVEWCPDLVPGSWTSVGVVESGTTSLSAGVEEVRALVPLGFGGRKFVRLVVEQQ